MEYTWTEVKHCFECGKGLDQKEPCRCVSPPNNEKCECGSGASHRISQGGNDTHRCCICHVREGGIPADFHPACMKAYQEINSPPPNEEQT